MALGRAATLLALLLAAPAAAFKDAEMKKCSDLYFCRTNRAKSGGEEVYTVEVRPRARACAAGGGTAALQNTVLRSRAPAPPRPAARARLPDPRR